jgi:hypothetical protein
MQRRIEEKENIYRSPNKVAAEHFTTTTIKPLISNKLK